MIGYPCYPEALHPGSRSSMQEEHLWGTSLPKTFAEVRVQHVSVAAEAPFLLSEVTAGFLTMVSASAAFWWGFCLSRVCVGGNISFFSWGERLSPLGRRELIMSPIKRCNWFSSLQREEDMNSIPCLFIPKLWCDHTAESWKTPDSQVVFCMFQTAGNKVQLTDECDLWQKCCKVGEGGGRSSPAVRFK